MRRVKAFCAALLNIYAVLSLILYLICMTNLKDYTYFTMVPFSDNVIGFAKTSSGMAVLVIIPLGVLSIYLISRFIDIKQETSKHRKRILRKRKRRNDRYLEEGIFVGRRAVI